MEKTLTPAYVRSIVRRRYLQFLIPAVTCAGIAFAVVASLPAIYRSQAKILVETQQIPPDLVPSMITALASERLQVIEQRITARDSILALAQKYKLFANKPNYSSSDIVEEVRSRISIEQQELQIGRQSGRDRVAMIFTVAYQDENPEMAARVANELVTSILQEDVKTRTALALETSRFLEKETLRLADELADVEGQLSKFRIENAAALPSRMEFNVSLLEKTQKDLVDIDRELLSIEDTRRLVLFEQRIRATSPDGKPIPGSLADLEQRINVLKSEIATLSGNYSNTHPEMRARRKALQALEAERAALKESIAKETSDTAQSESGAQGVEEQVTEEKLKSLDARVDFLKKQKIELTRNADDLRATIKRAPEVGAAESDLEHRREGLRKSLDDIGEKLAQAKLSERLEQDQQSERFEVIEQPVRPQAPSAPNRRRLLALSGALSAAFAGAIVYGLEFLDDAVRTSAGFEGKTGLRPLTSIPYIDTGPEVRRRRWRLLAMALGALTLLAAAAAGIHYFVKPLDEIYFRLLQMASRVL
jgi:polysaccharide chain length determinant protein (PEP-CTERM system associated)